MFSKYIKVTANTVEDYLKYLNEGYHPACIEVNQEISDELLDKLLSLVDESDDFKFAYILELYLKYEILDIRGDMYNNDIYEIVNQYLLDLINNSYIPAYIEFGLRGLRSADDIDKETYLSYIKASIENKDPIGCFEYGKYLLLEDFDELEEDGCDKGIELIEESGKLGLVMAYEYLGDLFSDEDFDDCDVNEAIKYYELCRKDNYEPGICKLADIYSLNPKKLNIPLAISLFEEAIKLGSVIAPIRLGDIYADSDTKVLDDNKAYSYYSEASKLSEIGKYKLGIFLIYKKLDFRVDKKITNVRVGIKYLEQLAKIGFSKACAELGELYYYGEYVKENLEKAFKYNSYAAECGNLKAEYFVAASYIYGYGVEKNFKLGFKKLKECAKYNVGDANILLGILYMRGYGFVKQNIDTAIKYFNKVDKNRYSISDLLGELYIRKSITYLENCKENDELSMQRLYVLKRII